MTTRWPQRKSPRLQGYDYAQAGAYFVTMVTWQLRHVFGRVAKGEMLLSAPGKIAHNELVRLPGYWHGAVDIDLFVVMPNHVHVILVLTGVAAAAQKRGPTLGRVVNAYKGGVTRQARENRIVADAASLWQSRYHDHIIRGESDLDRIRAYVLTNPARWAEDTLNMAYRPS